MTFQMIQTLLAVVLSLLLGGFVFGQNPKNQVNLAFFLFCLAQAYVSLCSFGMSIAPDAAAAQKWIEIGIFWPLTISTILHFSLAFTRSTHLLAKWQTYCCMYSLAPAFGSMVAIGYQTSRPVRTDWGWTYSLPTSAVFIGFLAIVSLLSIISIIWCARFFIRQRDSIQKKQAAIVLAALTVPVVTNALTQGLLPSIGIHPHDISHTATMVEGMMIAFAVWRYGLFTLTPEKAAHAILESMTEALVLVDTDGRIAVVNPATQTITGYERLELVGRPIDILWNEQTAPDQTPRGDAHNGALEKRLTTKSGKQIPVTISIAPVVADPDVPLGTVFFIQDLTQQHKAREEREQLKEQLFHAQKMEAIGQLAGGIAHDSGNMICAISGAAELIRITQCSGNPKLAEYVDTIMSAAARSTEMTRQLLAFARKDKNEVVPLDVHQTIGDVCKLLHATLNKNIKISMELHSATPVISGDKTQIQNAILNLAINARDAMAEGGTLTFTTGTIRIGPGECGGPTDAIAEGEYLKLCVSDTGMGMDDDTMARIFEPFFTTKGPGRGTGLGLASAYGTITGHGGRINAESSIGQGSTFTILLPVLSKSMEEKLTGLIAPVRGTGTIMLVEDEDYVRFISSEMLKSLGYEVVAHRDGARAADYYSSHHREINLVILDMIMPNCGGHDCMIRLQKTNPDVAVIVTSGHSAEGEVRKMMQRGAIEFLPKPFDISQLSKSINRAMCTTLVQD